MLLLVLVLLMLLFVLVLLLLLLCCCCWSCRLHRRYPGIAHVGTGAAIIINVVVAIIVGLPFLSITAALPWVQGQAPTDGVSSLAQHVHARIAEWHNAQQQEKEKERQPPGSQREQQIYVLPATTWTALPLQVALGGWYHSQGLE